MVRGLGTSLRMASRYQRLDEGSGRGAIAAGSFGRVYAAVDLHTKLTVAVKRQKLPSDAASKELGFYQALSQSGHPRVMRLVDHFVVGGSGSSSKQAPGKCNSDVYLYMVFDFMDSSLWQHWEMRRRLVSPGVAHGFILQGAAGVAHLHELGIVHTDLSMANMLLNHEGLRLADFGGAATAADLVFKKHVVVTTEYARAPEVFLGARELSSAIDVWSLGVCAMALLTGSLPFWDGPGLEPTGIRSGNTLANQVAFLGPVSSEVWPGCLSLPLFHELQATVEGPCMRNSPADFLADSSLVRRCMDRSDPAVDLLLAALRWDPARRLGAKDWLSHAFLSQPSQPPLVACSLVDALSTPRLRQVVLQSIVSGQAVTMESLCGGVDVDRASASERPEPLHDAKPLEACAGLEPSSANEEPVRKRLRTKTTIGGSLPQASSQIDGVVVEVSAPECPRVSGEAVVHFCACRANCGQKECKKQKNLIQRQRARATDGGLQAKDDVPVFCRRPPSGGGRLCRFCQCERCSKPRLQHHEGRGRWCLSCARSFKDTRSSGVYHNQYGTHRVASDWSVELTLVARYAWATNLAPPEDRQAWMDFVDNFFEWRQISSLSEVTECGDWLFIMVMACARWPTVLRESVTLRAGFEPRTASPAQWHAYLCRLLRWASGHPWEDMFQATSPGRSRCCLGLTWFCKRMGVVAICDGEAAPTSRHEVLLGASLQSYTILDCESSEEKITECMASVAEAMPDLLRALAPGLRAKSGHVVGSDVRSLGDCFLQLTGAVVGPRSEYARGSVVGSLLRIVEKEFGAELWDQLLMSDICRWVPDMNGHCVPLHSWRCRAVRERFGMSPLAVPACACMWGFVPKKHLPALKATPIDILNCITSLATPTERSPVPSDAPAGLHARWPQPHEWVVQLDAMNS